MYSPASEVVDYLKTFDADSIESQEDRGKILKAAKELVTRLERPIDQIYRLVWMEVLIDTDLFTKWVTVGGTAKTITELAKLSGIDTNLISRLLRHISAMGGLIEVSNDTYALTKFTKSLAGPGLKDSIHLTFDAIYPAFLHLPTFLARTSYESPLKPSYGNWQDLKQSSQSYIEYLSSDQERIQIFQNVMGVYGQNSLSWVDHYDISSLFKGLKLGVPAFVDVGGGRGHDAQMIHNHNPHFLKEHIILQDLPKVIEALEPEILTQVTPMVNDIRISQPIKGARVYFMHIVLHGFSDDEAMKILQNTAKAMEKGYSKLILYEKVVKDASPTADVTSMDLMMMALYSASERSESTWQNLLQKAGLKISRLITTPALFEAIIEVELI